MSRAAHSATACSRGTADAGTGCPLAATSPQPATASIAAAMPLSGSARQSRRAPGSVSRRVLPSWRGSLRSSGRCRPDRGRPAAQRRHPGVGERPRHRGQRPRPHPGQRARAVPDRREETPNQANPQPAQRGQNLPHRNSRRHVSRHIPRIRPVRQQSGRLLGSPPAPTPRSPGIHPSPGARRSPGHRRARSSPNTAMTAPVLRLTWHVGLYDYSSTTTGLVPDADFRQPRELPRHRGRQLHPSGSFSQRQHDQPHCRAVLAHAPNDPYCAPCDRLRPSVSEHISSPLCAPALGAADILCRYLGSRPAG